MVEIRQATINELEDIIKIEKECFPASEAATSDDLRKRFEAFKDNFLVAIKDGKVIGFINGCTTDKPTLPDELYHDVSLHNINGKYQTVFGLDVLPDYRRRGVAAKLLNHFINISKKRGKLGMVLTCKDHLISYYEKFGFKHCGVSASSHGGAKWNDMVMIF